MSRKTVVSGRAVALSYLLELFAKSLCLLSEPGFGGGTDWGTVRAAESCSGVSVTGCQHLDAKTEKKAVVSVLPSSCSSDLHGESSLSGGPAAHLAPRVPVGWGLQRVFCR